MAITMRTVARIFVFATEVTQGPLSSVHYTHIKYTPKSRCAICSGFEDTTKMSPRSRGTCPGDLAGDRQYARLHCSLHANTGSSLHCTHVHNTEMRNAPAAYLFTSSSCAPCKNATFPPSSINTSTRSAARSPWQVQVSAHFAGLVVYSARMSI
jgi:hypothetical protein